MENIQQLPHEKTLNDEQKILAEFNKYNLSLQDIGISADKQEYFKKIKIEKDLGNSYCAADSSTAGFSCFKSSTKKVVPTFSWLVKPILPFISP